MIKTQVSKDVFVSLVGREGRKGPSVREGAEVESCKSGAQTRLSTVSQTQNKA